ncbi:MAG: GxxExxY protein [Desulfuromonadales bacterium]|nr:GxxExxY protein [Desulfuromonadales bacterium]
MKFSDALSPITEVVIGSAIRVHRELGPGLLESAYEACLAYELTEAGFLVERQKPLPVTYKGVQLDCGYRLDLVVENRIILELKAVDKLSPLHEAQLLSYLKLSGISLGYLMNFHTDLMKNGIRRIVNNY